jgi:site-specific recombinase XerD
MPYKSVLCNNVVFLATLIYDAFMKSPLEMTAGRLTHSKLSYIDESEAIYGLMLVGFANQMKSRRLNAKTIEGREQTIERFRSFVEFRYPWQWRPIHFDEYIASLVDKGLALGTLRGYQGDIHSFVSYLRDPQYEWQEECRKRFAADCEQICHEGNMIVHASDYEGSPSKRPFTYDEVERFFDCADERIDRILRDRKKGALSAYRNSAIVKAVYGWGLRRNGARMLDTYDFSVNPDALQFGSYGVCHVRFSKAVRGGQPRQYAVLTIPELAWAAQAIQQYVKDVRPRYLEKAERTGKAKTAMFLTERGTRIGYAELDEIFKGIRQEAGLADDLTLHSLRHSFSTHQTEWGYDRAFVQCQLGHEHPSTTSIYTHVSSDFKQHQIRRAVQKALPPGFRASNGL